MFVKKFVEKAAAASRKQARGGSIHGLKAEVINPHLAFHYGIPSGSSVTAFDLIQSILAISTNDGRIKLFGMDGTQALLQSDAPVPSKFLQFIENQGILLNINFQNQIEVWDIDKKVLCYVHISNEEITSYAVLQQSLYMYIGNCHGDVYVMKLDEQKLVNMQYRIPFTESYGKMSEIGDENAVVGILPQAMSETMRVLLLFKDGLISLWDIQESKVVYSAGGNTQLSSHHELKKAVAACWACPFGSKLVVGYSNGEVFIWAIPMISDQKAKSKKDFLPNVPLFKLNLGYKTDKVPIVSVRWVGGDGTTSRLYVNGYSDLGSCSFQVIVLNENSESRIIKLVLPLTETCIAMEIISCFSNRTKHKQDALLLLTKSGQLYIYNESQIERYLVQCQSKPTPSFPNHFVVKLPFSDSSITVAKLYTSYSVQPNIMEEEHFSLIKKYSNLFVFDRREKDANVSSSANFERFAKTNSLCITGHEDGAVNFWDASCPLLFPIFSIKHQSEDSNASVSIPVTALHFDISSQILVIGDQNGLARIITFKKEQLGSDNIFSFLQAKQGGNYTIRSVKVKGAIQCISINPESTHLAIGTDKGFVFMFEMEGTTNLYQKQFPSQLYAGTFSLQFENCSYNGYAKNVLLVGMQDSSISFIDEDTGSEFNANVVHTKKPARALLMQILDASSDGVCTSDSQLLFCSENAVRLYSLSHAVQGIKKVNIKKKLSGTCCFASIVYGSSSDVGLVLVFAGGKVEIRSLPDLSLLKDASLRGFPNLSLRSCPNPRSVICASPEGEVVMVNGDQEILFFSVSFQKGTYRKLEHITQVYKDIIAVQEGSLSVTDGHKEKKKGMFIKKLSLIKDFMGNKSKNIEETNSDDPSVSNLEEISSTFSTANFPQDSEDRKSSFENEEDIELDIDDIDLEDTKERPKERSFGILNKQKLGKKFQAIKGKLKNKTDEKSNSPKDVTVEDKGTGAGAVDQIKMKYGYAVNNETSTLRNAQSKLSENVKKLQGINDRTSEMQANAQSFSTMAKELLRSVQKDKKSS